MTNRRQFTAAVAGGSAMLAAPALVRAQAATLKIGYSASKTGPNAGGVATQITPVYGMWVKEVNAAGGINVKGKKMPVEIVEYDDRSSSEEAVRAYERLATQDKVDFVLAPWSTGINLAVAPTLNKYNFPHLAVASITDMAPQLVKRWSNVFFCLGGGSMYGEALIDILEVQRKAGLIGSNIAMINIADAFGVDLSGGARKAAAKHGFKLVYDKSYPIGTQDMSPLISEAKATDADAFVAFSYPPDSIAITEQARVSAYNPKVFAVGVGTAFPIYKKRFGANVEGVMGCGGVAADSPSFQAFYKKHVEMTGQEPDRWANVVMYSTLQILQQAIERAGTSDRAAVIDEIKKNSFDTANGTMKFTDQQWTDLWFIGQWQNGEFYGVAPAAKAGAKKVLLPKPAWKAA
ncbi:MAG TPA: amino acid ABC transporter substrate-binding protein [Burkholderiaceae bacterium]